MRERLEQNMEMIAAQSAAQFAVGTLAVLTVLGLMTALGVIPLAGLIGGGLGYLTVQVYVRVRYG